MTNVDTSRLEAWKDQKARARSGNPASTSGGGGPTSGGMEARVKALEDKFDKIDSKLDTIVRDVAEMKGKVSNLPATWQIAAIVGSLLALTVAAGIFGISLFRAVMNV